jgi:hypothetical protein
MFIVLTRETGDTNINNLNNITMSKISELEAQQIEVEMKKLSEEVDRLIVNFKNTYKDKIGLSVERNRNYVGDKWSYNNSPHVVFNFIYEKL